MKKKGFTLIELLVVIAIIGLLSTLAVVALNSARAKARDAKRVGDVKQMQTALELYYNDNQGYPISNAGNAGVIGVDATCLGANGFNWDASACTQPVYMGLLPKSPTPPDVSYIYSAVGAGAGDCITAGDKCATYSIAFTLEGKTGDLAVGAHTATQVGMQ